MTETLGIALRAGFAREALVSAPTWPAASAAALTSLLPLLDIQGNDGVEKASYSTVETGLGPAGFDVLRQAPSAALPLQCTYQGLETLWACALGHMAKRLQGTLMPEQVAPGVYRHLYELDTRLSTAQGWTCGDGFHVGTELAVGQRKVRRGTLAADYQVSVWEWVSSMIQAITLQAEPGGVTLAVELVSYRLARDSLVNTALTMGHLLPTVAPRVLFTDLVVRIGPSSAVTPLGSGEVVRSSSWTLRLENNLVTSFGPVHGLHPDEYERAGAPRVTLTFVDPRHTADTWQTRWGTNTVLMAEARFTSERSVAPGEPYRLGIYLPSCHVTNAQLGTVSGGSVPPDTVQLVGVVPSAPAAGFPTMSRPVPLAVEVVSGVSQHPLL